MTLADAIIRARAGEQEGFAYLYQYTVPHVWLAAVMLGCAQPGTVVAQVYCAARQAVSSLRSPSDLRVWIGRIAYNILLQQPERSGRAIPALSGTLHEVYCVMQELPRQERTALLMLCGEGCSAAQAADILSVPDIEVKRSMRRARQTIAGQMKQKGMEETCNTAWLIDQMAALRAVQSETDALQQEQVLHCVWTGKAYAEPEELATVPQHTVVSAPEPAAQQEKEEKGGFFQKLFRSHRFG
ncbi:MAG: sigma factor-like helix-turn-helix DNA-binding protein [Eubacteriales bacterium]|nr:sigma factor-like helix-turn-helix DNA-binding protein [Eubacteriales bacterium]